MIFAEDASIFSSNSNTNKLFENLNKELGNITNWCIANKLSLNTSKTNS